jgi:hypothetical protein
MRRLKTPGWLATRSAKVALFGFVLNLAGVLGGAFWLDPARKAEDDAASGALREAARSRAILAANASDELAMHMGSLVFGVGLPPDPSEAVVATIHDLHVRALDRRHDGVRGYLALLGVAGALDYPAKLAAYEKLVEAEHANLTLETYRAANAFDADLAIAMVKAQGDAAMKALTLLNDRMTAKAVMARRNAILLAMSLAGSTILFIATMAGVSKAAPAPQGATQRVLALAAKRLARRRAEEGAAA